MVTSYGRNVKLDDETKPREGQKYPQRSPRGY